MGESGLKVEISIMDRQWVSDYWNMISPVLDRACEYSLYTIDHIYQELMEGNMSCWTVVEEDEDILGYIVTAVWEWPKGRMMHIMLLAGERVEDWFPLWPAFEAYARVYGCNGMTLTGRMGWLRKLRDENFTATQVTMVRPVERLN